VIKYVESTNTEGKKAKYWMGDIGHCDICKAALRGDFFDARTYSGPWATLCLQCWKQHTPMTLGTGHGQHYKETTQGKWLKVAG